MIDQPSYVVRINYVPDPLAHDTVTIGVIVLSNERTDWRFLTRRQEWDQVEDFGRESITYVREWLRTFERRLKDQSLMVSAKNADIDYFERLAVDTALSSIQLTQPQPVFLDLDATLKIYSQRLLRLGRPIEPTVEDESPRVYKTHVIRHAQTALEEALIRRVNEIDAKTLVVKNRMISGKLPHRTDLALANGRVLQGSFAISFDRPIPGDLELARNNILWAVTDIRSTNETIPLSVLLYPPARADTVSTQHVQQIYYELNEICADVSVDVVPFESIDEWAIKAVGRYTGADWKNMLREAQR